MLPPRLRPAHHRTRETSAAAPRRPARARSPRLRLLGVALALGVILTACASGATQPSPTEEPAEDAIRMAAVGDSITDANSPDLPAGEVGTKSWVGYAVGPQVRFVGGWAVWGASTEQMASETPALEADVLVILAGTNDAGRMPHEQIGSNLARIAEVAGVEEVVLSSVPPIDSAPEAATELNEFLRGFAADQGWTWVDAAAGLRAGDRFAEGMADDGVHPTAAGAEVLGEAIGAAVLEAGS
ncbi:SGNH/GDSL hydrolase family protein [Pseudactinotalea sp. Z1732]|uniref:SGNH/GDSL hydrolase family protein n=1 Tax=Micrococcales TaxID=85006 RepID=UPI003C7CC7F5